MEKHAGPERSDTDTFFQYPNVVVKNIDSDQHQILEMLDSLPFKVVANQYEMTRIFS